MQYEEGSGRDPFEGTSPYSARTRDAIERWLQAAALAIGLPGWRVIVSAGLPKSDRSIAENFLRDSAEVATIAIGSTFFSYPEPERRETLVHELLHCHLHALTLYARDAVSGELGKRWEALFDMTIAEHEELACDRLARAIAPMLAPSPEDLSG